MATPALAEDIECVVRGVATAQQLPGLLARLESLCTGSAAVEAHVEAFVAKGASRHRKCALRPPACARPPALRRRRDVTLLAVRHLAPPREGECELLIKGPLRSAAGAQAFTRTHTKVGRRAGWRGPAAVPQAAAQMWASSNVAPFLRQLGLDFDSEHLRRGRGFVAPVVPPPTAAAAAAADGGGRRVPCG